VLLLVLLVLLVLLRRRRWLLLLRLLQQARVNNGLVDAVDDVAGVLLVVRRGQRACRTQRGGSGVKHFGGGGGRSC
jgi:hypothetical protein